MKSATRREKGVNLTFLLGGVIRIRPDVSSRKRRRWVVGWWWEEEERVGACKRGCEW